MRDIPNIEKMSTSEKILLVEELWDSIISNEADIPMPESHIEELNNRFKDYKTNPDRLLSLYELQDRIEKMT
ncbi:Addiction module component, CHP02574 [Candidatus Magnetoovum chiemensis]|nr:Addiction module component, CHP02574 [Candidatus Magnetoovum chiemensis]